MIILFSREVVPVFCYCFSAPIASALINKFGCRPVGIAGSLLASAAFVVCTLSEDIETMIFLFGVCGGKIIDLYVTISCAE